MNLSDWSVRVRAPSRLHFGLLAFGAGSPRQFGGVGVMVHRPETEIRVRLLEASTPPGGPTRHAARRAYQFASRFRESLESSDERARLENIDIQVLAAPPEHVGLGSGTQIAMSVARALAAFVGRSDATPDELAGRVGRGGRSAIGVHGFQLGGFIVEGGKSESSGISPVVARLNFPDDWHFVLIIADDAQGHHGPAEAEAFDRLQSIDASVTADLCRLTLLGLLPAVADRDFAAFSAALVEFGRKVGECFAPFQGGVYSSPLAGAVLESLEGHGMRGIAQSSWGPTLAIPTDSRFRAEWLAARLTDQLPAGTTILCTTANNLGAKVEVLGC
jgi:beta-ribofuranosylaminobenzene 5'-phosphate synthase